MKSLVVKSLIGLPLVLGSQSVLAAESESLMNLQSDTGLLMLHSTITLLLLIIFLVLASVLNSMTNNKRLTGLIKANKVTKVALVGLLLSLSGSAMAQGTAASSAFMMSDSLLWTFISVDVILVSLILYEISLIKKIFKLAAPQTEEEVEEKDWVLFGAKLTDNVPIEKEADVLLDHNYDGIRELDNNLPPWWLYGFYLSIVFAVLYLGYYTFGGGMTSAEAYQEEMEIAKVEVEAYLSSLSNRVDESNVVLLAAESDLLEGKSIYEINCASCHGMMGEGGVGPTFADNYWKHGGGIKNVFKTIKYGVVEKGMIPWESALSPGEMQKVASYVLSFEGSNPPGMKEPEGEIWEESASSSDAPAMIEGEEGATESTEDSVSVATEDVAQL